MGVKLAEPFTSFNHDVMEDRWDTVSHVIFACVEDAWMLGHFLDPKTLIAQIDPTDKLLFSAAAEQKSEFSFCSLLM